MNARERRYIAYICLLVVLLLPLLIAAPGCSFVNVSRAPDGTLDVTYRAFLRRIEAPNFHLERDGDGYAVDFNAAAIDTAESQLAAIGAGVVNRAATYYWPLPPAAPAPVQPLPEDTP